MNSIGTSDTIDKKGDNVGAFATISLRMKRKHLDDIDVEPSPSKYLKTEQLIEKTRPERNHSDNFSQDNTEEQFINVTLKTDDPIRKTNDHKSSDETLTCNDDEESDNFTSSCTNTINIKIEVKGGPDTLSDENDKDTNFSFNNSQTLSEIKKSCGRQSSSPPAPSTLVKKPNRPEAVTLPKLYRLLNDGEDITKGLTAKDPNAKVEVAVHVATGSKRGFSSQFISTCSSYYAADNLRKLKLKSGYKWGMKDIAEIDVALLPEDVQIIDLRYVNKRKNFETGTKSIDDDFHRFANSHGEVLLVGTVTSDCLNLIKFSGTVVDTDSDDSDSWGF